MSSPKKGLVRGEGVSVSFSGWLNCVPPSAEIADQTSKERFEYSERHIALSSPVLENAIQGLKKRIAGGPLIATGPVQLAPESLVVYTLTAVGLAVSTA